MSIRTRIAASPRLGDILTPDANSFGVLRFLMATFVLISHSYMFSAGTSDVEPLVGWLGRSLGECAVQVFFILSGVMVARRASTGAAASSISPWRAPLGVSSRSRRWRSVRLSSAR